MSAKRKAPEAWSCPQCTGICHHCGRPPEADGDHSCPCPLRDEDCQEHPLLVCAYHYVGHVFSDDPEASR